MTEPTRPAWGCAMPSSSHSSHTPVPEHSVRATDFPVLGTQAPSKAAARKRAIYALDRKTFDAYPPRNEVLARRQMEQQQQQLDGWRRARGGDLLDADTAAPEHSSQQDESETSDVRQQYGMSSVTFHDKTGSGTTGRPAIYSKSGSRSGDATSTRVISSDTQQRRFGAEEEDELRGVSSADLAGLPHPMTIERIDALMRETQRAQRARAARLRQSGSNGERDTDADPKEQPLMDELTRALSSMEGFLAAFGSSAT